MSYEQKYLKYKQKYLELKKKLEMNGGSVTSTNDIHSPETSVVNKIPRTDMRQQMIVRLCLQNSSIRTCNHSPVFRKIFEQEVRLLCAFRECISITGILYTSLNT